MTGQAAIAAPAHRDDWCARFVATRIDVSPGDHGELPARLLGLEREGAQWRVVSPETAALLERARAGAEFSFVRPYDDPLVGPRSFRFSVAADGPAVLVHACDVTACQARREALGIYARLFHAMHEGVLTVADGTVVIANPAAEAMLGYVADGLAGLPVERLGPELAALLASTRIGDGDPARTVELLRADGEPRHVSATVRPLPERGSALLVLRDVTERLRLERELLATERRERERIARDLHDGVGQELTAVSLLLKGIASRLRKTDARTADELDEVLGLVNGAIGGTRSMARGLYEAALPAGGLVGALGELARRIDGADGCRVEFRDRVEGALALEHAHVVELYRIAQEAIENARRHADASLIAVELVADGSEIVLSVDDDGVGLPPDVGSREGMGLNVMRYRAHVLGTELAIGRSALGGTRVECRVRLTGAT